MNKLTRRAFGAAGFALMLATSASFAQQTPPVRVRGEITKIEGDVLDIKSRTGETLKLKLVDPGRVTAMVKAALSDIKVGSYIGVTAIPQADGSQKAIGIHIFMESQRGLAEGFRPWDREPNSTMTNAAVESTVAGVDGQTIMVKYKDGEKKVIVPANCPIVAYQPGTKADLKVGAHVFIVAATKQPDGSLTSQGISVGRDGVVPPM
jgi:hypothetical protein